MWIRWSFFLRFRLPKIPIWSSGKVGSISGSRNVIRHLLEHPFKIREICVLVEYFFIVESLFVSWYNHTVFLFKSSFSALLTANTKFHQNLGTNHQNQRSREKTFTKSNLWRFGGKYSHIFKNKKCWNLALGVVQKDAHLIDLVMSFRTILIQRVFDL